MLANIMGTAFEDYSVHKSVTQNIWTECQRQFPWTFMLRHTACVKAGEARLLSEPHSGKCTQARAAVSQSVRWYPPYIILDPAPVATFVRNFFISLHEQHQGEWNQIPS